MPINFISRCGCSVISTTTCSNTKCCLILCHLLADKDMYPCEDTKEFDLTSKITIPSCCDVNDIQLRIPYHTDNLVDVTFNKVGNEFLIQATSNYSEGKNFKDAKIVYEVECGILRNQAEIIIPFKQLNESFYNCKHGYDPCTGLCKDPEYNVRIGGGFGLSIS